MVEVRLINDELIVWWRNDDHPITDLKGHWRSLDATSVLLRRSLIAVASLPAISRQASHYNGENESCYFDLRHLFLQPLSSPCLVIIWLTTGTSPRSFARVFCLLYLAYTLPYFTPRSSHEETYQPVGGADRH
jgi:hypothetical protein